MKKKLIIFTLLITLAASMHAQVFMLDGDENYRDPDDPGVFVNLPENYGLGVDWYVPVGDGLLLLAALGGAYLSVKRKNGNNQTNK